MNIIRYNGNLEEDIKYSKPFNKKKEIKNRIISFILGIPIYILGISILGLDKDMIKTQIIYFSSFYFLSASAIQYVIHIILEKLYSELNKDANKRLDNLVNDLNTDNILVDKENIQSAIIKENQEKTVTEKNGIKKSQEIISNQFYFLDKEEKIRFLKQIKRIIKLNKKIVNDETTLYYSDEDLTNQENIPVEIIKRLERF